MELTSKTITIRSSNGMLMMDADNGKVVSKQLEKDGDPHILSITQFDIAEWKQYHTTGEMPDSIDILDFGYWYDVEGIPTYEPPVEDWREFIKTINN